MLYILLINDNKIVSRLLQLSSKKSGFDMEESGIFSPQKESYNLIFIDSDKYNKELVDKIKSNLTYDKLVFIGTNQVKKPEEFELILEKPFLPADFTSLVESNFITDSEKSDQDDNTEKNEEFNFDDELNSFDDDLEATPEKLSKLIDDIDKDDINEDDNLNLDEDEMDIDDDLLNFDDEDEQDIEIDENLPNIDDEFEEKIEDTAEKTNLEEVIEETLEEIEDEEKFEEKEDEKSHHEIEIEEEKKDPLLLLDEKELKKVIEPELVEEIDIVDDIKLEKNTVEDNGEKSLENIVKEQLKEIITSDLLKDALKDMQINITFSSKDS